MISPSVPARLRSCVESLAALGERSTRRPAALHEAARWIEAEFVRLGMRVERANFRANGVECANLDAAVPGFDRAAPHILIGAHYDSAWGTPGADDNLSAVAILLELAARLGGHPSARQLRFVAFPNEEPPHFLQGTMGSLVFARECRARRDAIAGMVCLESLGVFLHEPRSQFVPPEFSSLLPDRAARGDFVAIIGNDDSLHMVAAFQEAFRTDGRVPTLGASLPQLAVSDHWSFWQCAYPAVMLTDTAMMRNPHYHLPTDTPEHLDYETMAAVTDATEAGVGRLLAGIAEAS
jgi:Zn-dependent M28 family amino/carboxypeptidase